LSTYKLPWNDFSVTVTRDLDVTGKQRGTLNVVRVRGTDSCENDVFVLLRQDRQIKRCDDGRVWIEHKKMFRRCWLLLAKVLPEKDQARRRIGAEGLGNLSYRCTGAGRWVLGCQIRRNGGDSG